MKPEPVIAQDERGNVILKLFFLGWGGFLHSLSKLVPHPVFLLDSTALKTSMISNILLLNPLKEREGYNFLVVLCCTIGTIIFIPL